MAYLLAFFNPSIRSLRTIEDLSQTRQAQKHLSVRKICKSTLSDFQQLVDPTRLGPIIDVLRKRLRDKQADGVGRNGDSKNTELNSLLTQTVAVDGTFLHAVSDVAWAVANNNNHGAKRHRARLDARIDVNTWLPETLVVPPPGKSESDSAIRHVQPGRVYLYDRGYTGFALLKAHYEEANEESVQTKAHFVVRYKATGSNTPTLCDVTEKVLTDEDRAAGIVSDRVGCFSSQTARRAGVSSILLREVVVPYEKDGQPKTLRLITNLLDVSAQTIVLLYQYRWQVELFFRWFKSISNFGHLISHSRNDVMTHLYVTIIGVMLMYLHTGSRPSKYLFAMLSQVAAGDATLDEILPILRERERRTNWTANRQRAGVRENRAANLKVAGRLLRFLRRCLR